MSITTLVEVPAAPGKGGELIALLKKNLGDTRARQGCELSTTHQEHGNPDVVLLIQRWSSRADDDAYREWRGGPGAIEGFGDLMGGDATIRYFDDADA